MLRIKTGLVLLLMSLAINSGGAAGCRTKQDEAKQRGSNQPSNSNAPVPPVTEEAEKPLNNEIKVMAEGAYAKVSDAFIVVARDAATYTTLRQLVDTLPQLGPEFFRKNMVVAAFLGGRRTGGYGVSITLAADNRLQISSTSPPAGSMTTQALTAPFKVVSVSVGDNRPLAVAAGAAWTSSMRPYRVTSGEFTTGGGFAGRFEKLQLAGDIGIARHGQLLTFIFDLKGTGGKKPRSLQDIVSGVSGQGGSLSGAVSDAGTLVDYPRSPLLLKGNFTENDDKLSLTFESLPATVADGYGGEGKLEAAAIGPAPPKKATSGDEPM